MLLEDAQACDTVSFSAGGKAIKFGKAGNYTVGGKEIQNVTIKTVKLKFNAFTGKTEFNKGNTASKDALYEYRTR